MNTTVQQFEPTLITDNPGELEYKIVDRFPGITFICYPQKGSVYFLNGKMKELAGRTVKETDMAGFYAMLSRADVDATRQAIQHCTNLKDEESQQFHFHLKHADGRELFFRVTGTVLTRDQKGAVNSILFLAQENPEEENSADSHLAGKQVKIDQLERSNKELEEFAYAASHDLQEPLRKISTFTEKLKKQASLAEDDDSRNYIERILKTTRHMRTLIDSLLDFGKLAHDKKHYETVDLEKLAKEAVADMKIPGHVQIEMGNLPRLMVIPSQLRQLFMNLISNAIKFRSRDRDCMIQISSRKLSEQQKRKLKLPVKTVHYEIRVSDNGIGFEPEFAEKIFQPFQRLHGKTEYPGSGIGLAICRKILEYHNGRIYAEGELDKGACFHIILPEVQETMEK